jgi:hypothetical protein
MVGIGEGAARRVAKHDLEEKSASSPTSSRTTRDVGLRTSCPRKGWRSGSGSARSDHDQEYGSIMRRVIALTATAMLLGGCSSFSFDYFKSAPPEVQLQLESVPPGAEARTSIGQGCKTPCSVTVVPPEGAFTVSYTLANFQPATVTVEVTRVPGELFRSATTKINPNPVIAELQALPKAHKPMRPNGVNRPRETAAVPPTARSPFPDPVPPPPGFIR